MRLQELNYVTVQLSQNQTVIPLLYAKDLNSLTEYQFYTLVRELKNYRATNGFIENVSIYFRNFDIVVNSDGKYSMPVFFSQVYHYNNLLEDGWDSDLRGI
jgi:hypothetical protein